MKRLYTTIIYTLLFCFALTAQATPQPCHRIISLAPSITELLFAAGAGRYVIGIDARSDYPPVTKKLPIVANFDQINIEKIVQLQPDLIVAWRGHNATHQLEFLKNLGFQVIYSNPQNLLDIADEIERLGKYTGTEQAAKKNAAHFRKEYAALKKRYEHHKKVKVFFEISQSPLITINRNSFIGECIRLCNGMNVFGKLSTTAPSVNLEAVIQANPDVIIAAKSKSDWKAYWLQWPELSAVKRRAIYNIDPDLIERPSPRILEGIKQMCKQVQK